MIIRKLRSDEKYKARLASAVAFEFGIDLAKEKENSAQAKETDAAENVISAVSLPSDAYTTDTWGAFTDDDDTIMASMFAYPYTVRFDGTDVLMRGVGGVATLPPYRRQGAIRECMRAFFADMHSQGFLFSCLYPFSTAFYRQFGYSCGGRVNTWEVGIGGLRKNENVRGSVKMILPGDDMSALDHIYAKMSERYNMAVRRVAFDRSLEDANTLEQRRYIYVWCAENGEPRGFMITKKSGDVMDAANDFSSRGSFYFLDAAAFTGLMNFALTFASNYKAVRFSLPEDIKVDRMIGEGTELSCSQSHNGMVRVIDVEEVLKLCRTRGESVVKIGIRDNMAPWNTGVWRVRFGGGKTEVENVAGEADVYMDISDFSALITGAADDEDMRWMPGVHVINQSAPFGGLFYRKPYMLWDLF